MNYSYNQIDNTLGKKRITPIVKWLLIVNIGIFLFYTLIPILGNNFGHDIIGYYEVDYNAIVDSHLENNLSEANVITIKNAIYELLSSVETIVGDNVLLSNVHEKKINIAINNAFSFATSELEENTNWSKEDIDKIVKDISGLFANVVSLKIHVIMINNQVPFRRFMDVNFSLYPMGFITSDFSHVWQLVTHMFTHFEFMHILFNMFMLWMLGSILEYHMGGKQFLTYFMICGGCSGIIIYLLTSNPTIGASGAIYGVLGAMAYFWPNMPMLVFGIVPAKVKHIVIGLALFSILLMNNDDSISHLGHLAGLVVGLVYLQIKYKQYNFRNLFKSKKITNNY